MKIRCSQLQAVVLQLTVLSNTIHLLPVTKYPVQLNYFIWTLHIILLSTNYRHSLHKVIPIPIAVCHHTAFRDKCKRCLYLDFLFLSVFTNTLHSYVWMDQLNSTDSVLSGEFFLWLISLYLFAPLLPPVPQNDCQLEISGCILATGDCKVTTLLSS